ncbi:MAG: alpha/beta hydrolase [Phycisphaerales bacterium]|nr:alpha/beta hydrolase [Phycisphaerales bacterium]
MRPIPLILLPGMGARAEIYAAQFAEFPELIVPVWLPPLAREPLPEYARRMAGAVDPGTPCIIGGTSFGGFVAVEMRRHLDCRGCILISSVRSPRDLPRRVRMLHAVSPLFAPWACRLAVAAAPLASRILKPVLKPAATKFLRQVASADAAFLRWAIWATLRWRDENPGRDRAGDRLPPIRLIHGTRDHILPAHRVHADEFVSGAGHLLVMTHAERANVFIRRAAADFARDY